jgi:hypothetical protein
MRGFNMSEDIRTMIDKIKLLNEDKIDTLKNIFNKYNKLSEIGSIEQYREYINTIFPNSNVRDIVYHGGTLNIQDRGKDQFTGKYGIYFTGSESRAKSYIKSGNKEYQNKSKIYEVLINIQNPLDSNIWRRWKFNADMITDKEYDIIKKNNSDGIIVKDFLSNFTQYNTQYVVFNIEQVHILGSEKDINGFSNFINKELF